jgi:hypothetical protein
LSQPFSLRKLPGGVADTLASRMRQKGLQFDCGAEEDVPHRLIGDPLRIGQIPMNLPGCTRGGHCAYCWPRTAW